MDEKCYSQMQNKFYEAYSTEIVPVAKKYEQLRKLFLVKAITVPALFVFGGLLFCKIKPDSGINEIIALILIGLTVSYWHFVKKFFENSFKTEIMPAVCKCFGDLTWKNGAYSNGTLINESKVVPSFSKEHYDDVFKGSFKNVNYEIIEAKLGVMRIDRDEEHAREREETVFKGVVIRFEMNKNFDGHTVIRQKNMFPSFSSNKITHKSEEDTNFEKMYEVFTDDEDKASSFLTTFFKERLTNIKNVFMSGNLSCAFYKNNFFIALETQKDLFSLGSLVKPADDCKQIFSMYEEIVSIIKLIDYFELDEKIDS